MILSCSFLILDSRFASCSTQCGERSLRLLHLSFPGSKHEDHTFRRGALGKSA
jgi:hypothetical protein